MSDSRNTDEQGGHIEPVTGHDPTNGLVDGLEGDDGGAVDPSADHNVIGDVIGNLDDPYEGPNERGEGETSYSEEGQP